MRGESVRKGCGRRRDGGINGKRGGEREREREVRMRKGLMESGDEPESRAP